MADGIIRVKTVAASDGDIVSLVIGSPINKTYTSSIAGSEALFSIPEADLIQSEGVPWQATLESSIKNGLLDVAGVPSSVTIGAIVFGGSASASVPASIGSVVFGGSAS